MNGCSSQRPRGRSRVTPLPRWTCAPIRKTFRPASSSRDPALVTPALEAGTIAARTWNAVKSMTSFPSTELLVSRRSPETGIASGPGWPAKSLPPNPFDPVGIAFVVGSISAPGEVEAIEHVFPKQHPLRPLFLGQASTDNAPQPTINMLLRHGVRSCLEYAKSGDITRAWAVSNPELSPHLSFVDMGGHGYAIVRATSTAFETEFVCIPRPLERSDRADGGPLLYRARFITHLWGKEESPKLSAEISEFSASVRDAM